MKTRICKNCSSEVKGIWTTTCPNCHKPLRLSATQTIAAFIASGLTLVVGLAFLLAIASPSQTHQTLVQGTSTKRLPTATPTLTPSNTVTPIVTPWQANPSTTRNTKYAVPIIDGTITCNFQHLGGQKLTSSQCQQSFECQVGSQWYIYTSRDICAQDQRLYFNNNSYHYVPPTYPTLTPLSYPTNSVPTFVPVPTHDAFCDTIDTAWQQFVANFDANQRSQYNSSVEANNALNQYRQSYQSQADSHNCHIIL